MKYNKYILLILAFVSYGIKGQETNDLNLKDLKRVHCNGVNDESFEKQQLQCMMVDVVLDSINYFPSMSRANDSLVSTPEQAWEALKKNYSDFDQDKFVCWTEYADYYCFAFDCGLSKKKKMCSFVCMFYIRKKGNEFWYFVLRT